MSTVYVEGVHFVVAKDEHRRELLDFMLDYFRVEEPITSAVETSREAAYEFYIDLREAGLRGADSYLALDTKTNKIVGCCLNEVSDMDHKTTCPTTTSYGYPSTDNVWAFVEALHAPMESLLSSSRRLLEIGVIAVHPHFMRKGIGSKLLELTLVRAEQRCCDTAATTATALRSQRLFDKFGFETLFAIPYVDYKKEGKVVFGYLHDGATCGKLMAKKMQIKDKDTD